MTTINRPPELTQAIQLHQAGKHQESRDCLRDFLLQQPAQIDALLWLAKVTPDPYEALAAAELALKLEPENEIAQRAVIAVRKREGEPPEQATGQAELLATIVISTGMTLAQARAVKWPFRGINRPLGEVLDDKNITLRDLAWAIENAWDDHIRAAAKTVLLTYLVGAEPDEPPVLLKVIAGSRFSEQQERRSVLFLGLLLGIGMALLAVATILAIIAMILQYGYGRVQPRWYLVVFGVLFLVWIVFKWSDRFYDQEDQYQQGRWGEEKVVDVLRYSLDGRWTLFRNLEWPNRKWGDVDLVLVGPGGVWAFEVKAYSGKIRNVGDRWERKGKRRWRKLTIHPGHQARQNAARLREYLKNHGVDVQWVEPIVAWASESGDLSVQDPATPVWGLKELPDRVEELWQRRSLSEETVQHIVDVLEWAVQATEENNK